MTAEGEEGAAEYESPLEDPPRRMSASELFEQLADGHAPHALDERGHDAMSGGTSSSDDEDASPMSAAEKLAEPPGQVKGRGTLPKVLLSLQDRRSRLVNRLRGQIDKVKRRAKQADAVKFQDKLMFTAGVFNFAMTCYLSGAQPAWIPHVYSAKFLCLIALRLYFYRKEKFGYFLLDFCYFANLVWLWYLWRLPDSIMLFRIAFAFANGPLGMAVVAWRNSLVFHSLDKITSLFIHIEPVLVSYVMRHVLPDQGQSGVRWRTGVPGEGWLDVCWDMIANGLLVYIAWQCAYYLKVQVLDKEKIKRRNRSTESRKYVTSFIFLRDQKSALGSMIRKAPRRHQHCAFAAIQLGCTVFMLLLAPLLYFSAHAHFAWLLFILGYSIWNGSCFYFEVFSARYQEQLRQLQISKNLADDLGAETAP
mmetsp:Transcript_26026/g.74508  ORF Transcript_26026/g.74508 Transcript_26026/m.74508 type:complete len:421 (+) Transcript_26026:125-1387(+)